MKILFTSFILFIFGNSVFSQTIDIITGLTEPTTVAKVGNTIYYGEFNGNLNKFDLSDIDAGITTITNTNGIYRSTLRGDELYFTEIFFDRISSLNVTEDTPSSSTFVREISFPIGITSDEENIYYSELINDVSTISKVFVDDPESKTLVYSTLDGITAICKQGDIMYFLDDVTNRVLKFDVTQSPVHIEVVATGFQNPTDILCAGDILIVSDFDSGKVVEIDLSLPNMPVTNILTDLDGPTGIFLEGNDLYVSIYFQNKIIKHTLSSVRVNNVDNDDIKIFPNPTIDYLQVSGFNNSRMYEIINNTGILVKSGSIINDSFIDLKDLSPGNYYIILENGTSASFIKS